MKFWSAQLAGIEEDAVIDDPEVRLCLCGAIVDTVIEGTTSTGRTRFPPLEDRRPRSLPSGPPRGWAQPYPLPE